ncbi:TetR family transcriptional regulator [Streptosporangium violaceochromogenes]|nr:TetR family transcriptional regulator [Streptosporangium violaceochromogenes]
MRESAELFARQGYYGTGLSELLSAVGLHKGGFYHHISSKEDLLLEIMLNPIDRVLESSRAIVEAGTTPTGTLQSLGTDLGHAMAENLSAWTIFLREYSSLGPAGRERVLALRRAYLDRWRDVLEKGIASGEFRPVDLAFVESIFGLFIYTFVWNREGADARSMTKSIMDVLMHGVSAVPLPPTAPQGG